MPVTFPVEASRIVAFPDRPLNANTCFEKPSYRIASGFSPVTFTSSSGFRVFRSKIVTVEARPLLVNPRPSSGASATPCTPAVFGISPAGASVSASKTMTRVPRVT